jgi:hypothetical protein
MRSSPWPFGEYLEDVLRTVAHRREHLFDVFVRDLAMEEVAHRIDENAAWFAELVRFVKLVRLQENVFFGVFWLPLMRCVIVPVADPLSITVFATGADFRAAVRGVPRFIRPRDVGLVHSSGSHHLAQLTTPDVLWLSMHK